MCRELTRIDWEHYYNYYKGTVAKCMASSPSPFQICMCNITLKFKRWEWTCHGDGAMHNKCKNMIISRPLMPFQCCMRATLKRREWPGDEAVIIAT